LIRPTDPASSARSPSPSPTVSQPPRHRRLWKNTILPLVTSLSLHAGLVAIGLLCFTAYKAISRVPEELPQPVIPVSDVDDHTTRDLSEGGDPGFPIPLPPQPNSKGVADSGLFPKPGKPTDTVKVEPIGTDDFPTSVGSTHNLPGTADDGEAPGFSSGKGIFQPGGGDGDGTGPGHGPGHNPTRYQPPLSTAYVCDASGSMMEKMPALKRELSNAVERLRVFQQFSIIFFQNNQPTALSPHLVRAIPENKRAAEDFINDASTTGFTNPIPGITEAFAQRPQVMFLLTDGDFPDNDAVLAEIRQLESQHHVIIHTIAFVGSADRQTKFLDLLKQVAHETGGTFKKVDAEALDGN
jgi:hypothetical protein